MIHSLVPIDFHTSDFIADEVSKTYSFEELEGFGLQVLEMSEEQMPEIEYLQGRHPELSPGDLSVYILAKSLDALLISGDGPFEKISCHRSGSRVHTLISSHTKNKRKGERRCTSEITG